MILLRVVKNVYVRTGLKKGNPNHLLTLALLFYTYYLSTNETIA